MGAAADPEEPLAAVASAEFPEQAAVEGMVLHQEQVAEPVAVAFAAEVGTGSEPEPVASVAAEPSADPVVGKDSVRASAALAAEQNRPAVASADNLASEDAPPSNSR